MQSSELRIVLWIWNWEDCIHSRITNSRFWNLIGGIAVHPTPEIHLETHSFQPMLVEEETCYAKKVVIGVYQVTKPSNKHTT